MNDKFLFGVVCGMLGGSLLIANSVKARQMVKDGQEQVKQKVEQMSQKMKKNSNEN